MYKWANGTIFGWRPEMGLYQSSLPTVFTAMPLLYSIPERPLESLRESLLQSLLESIFKCLLESHLERASHREEQCFPWEAVGRWKTVSLWRLWPTIRRL
jgi:hypothetical protein